MFQRIFIVCVMALFTFTSVLAVGNESFKKIDELIAKNQLSDAMNKISEGLKANPKEIELLARKSRLLTLMGDQKSDEKAKVSSYEEAEKVANEIISINDKAAKGYLRRAVAKGKLILYKGILQSRSLVLELRKDARKGLELSGSDAYDKALGNYLLGRAHLKLAKKPRALRLPLGLGWASKKKGGEFLKKAAEIYPNSISFNLSYAEYERDNGDIAKAKAIFEKIGTLAVFDPADPGHKETAKKALADL